MLFNSLHYAIFLPIVFGLYWYVCKRSYKWQNILLLLASYYFYACWDWRFLFLLLFSTLLDYASGWMMEVEQRPLQRKIWLWISIVINLGFLAYFKYYNFFIESFIELFANWGITIHATTLKIILPVGISFYTFHGLSYVIDIYKQKIPAEKNFISYAVFVSFFPLLVAGPIERATHLLPQIKQPRTFDYTQAMLGMKQILWGLFKKMVVADNCARYVNFVYGDLGAHDGSTILMASILFAVQIYGDFSGYSDIALGTARLFGIDLLKNFNNPYFSRDIAEFWRRWHISLSSWFRDYIYIPLGGSRRGLWVAVRNTFIIFVVSGFWHGANWTFVIWGAYHAMLFIPLLLLNQNKKNIDIVAQHSILPSVKESLQMVGTFFLVVIGWVFFRAASLTDAWTALTSIFSLSTLQLPKDIFRTFVVLLPIIGFCFVIEWWGRREHFALERLGNKHTWFRYMLYFCLVVLIFFLSGTEQEFIYFQF